MYRYIGGAAATSFENDVYLQPRRALLENIYRNRSIAAETYYDGLKNQDINAEELL